MHKIDLIHSTLVPIDFSVTSMFALEHAAAIAHISKDNAERVVTLLHVIEGSSFEPVYDIADIEQNTKDALASEGAWNRLENVTRQYHGKYDVKFRYIVAGGKPPRTIANVAEEIQAQSIVMGSHGSSGLQALAGSNASRVITLASCPVVVVREKPLGQGYKNIVLPLDLSHDTKQKVTVAGMIAEYYNSTVHIVSPDKHDEFLKQRIDNNLHQVTSYFADLGVACTTDKIPSSGFALATLEYAQQQNADLLIIMADDQSGLMEYINGSYAQQIVNKSTIPVMTVNPQYEIAGFNIIS